MVRTGIGYDVHQLAAGEKLVIGGIEIPGLSGSVGHSDGDGLIHAIVDALLGAAALGDIGKFFPSDDNKWENVNSVQFLISVTNQVRSANFEISNIDATILLQKPKLSNFIYQMRYNLASHMQLDESQLSIKATTTDHLGYIGQGEGWAVQAICTLQSID